jgi:hypothetical protein
MEETLLIKAKTVSPEDTFNVVEYATKKKAKDGREYFDRSNFYLLGENPKFSTKVDHYRSHFLHSSKIEEFCKTHLNKYGNNTTSGYDGAVWIDELVFDIDNGKDVNESLTTLRTFLRLLENNYGVELSYVKVNYSGSKGFHVRIPAVLFGGFEPSVILNDVVYAIMIRLTEGLHYFDDTIYKKKSIIRLVNSVHGKTNRYAIPLRSYEVFNKSMEQIVELANNSRKIDSLDLDELEAVPELVALKEDCLINYKKYRKEKEKSASCFMVNEGQRHDSTLKAVNKLCRINESLESITTFALAANKLNVPPEDEDILLDKVKEMYDSWWRKAEFFFIDDKDNVNIHPLNYIQTLEQYGFGKYYIDKNYIFVRIENNCLDEVKVSHIKDFVRNHLKNVESGDRAYNRMLENSGKYFGEELFEHLEAKNEKLIKDTKDTCHFFFKNQIVQVGGEAQIKYIPYPDSGGLIWKSQLINRDFKKNESKGDFERFLFNVVGQSEERLNSLRSDIGYLLHTYKNPSFAKAVILCDEKISDNPIGRTGKSLIGKAIGKLRKRLAVDGKNFNSDDKFSFQQVELGTQLIDYNDVKKNFPFERFFSIITDDMTTEKKRKDAINISFADSPKILISTNYTVKGVGDSYRDRMIEVEFSDYYNASHKPKDDFGKLFFDEWDEVEWSRFDNFMVGCATYYLQNGIVESTPINTIKKKIMEITGEDFYDFASNTIETGTEYIKSKLHGEFILKYPSSKNVSIRSFSSYLKTYADFKNLTYDERPSNGNQIIWFANK